MLDYKSEKVLSYLLKHSNQSISSLKEIFPNYDINEIHDYLVFKELIVNNNGVIKVTHKGKKFKEMFYRNALVYFFWTTISMVIGFLLGKT